MDAELEKPPIGGRRAMQAEQTRRDILIAARRRFGEHGYSGTSLKDIAGDAQVSVQTVYDSVGSKQELVLRLNDLIDDEAQVGEIAMMIGIETDPIALARIPARIVRRLVERCGDIVRAAVGGAQTEPGLRPALEEGNRRHRAGTASVAQRLAGLGALRTELSADDAALTISTLSDARVAFMLIDEIGLTLDQVEEWMAITIARAVLRS